MEVSSLLTQFLEGRGVINPLYIGLLKYCCAKNLFSTNEKKRNRYRNMG